jgi:hypothetical protein
LGLNARAELRRKTQKLLLELSDKLAHFAEAEVHVHASILLEPPAASSACIWIWLFACNAVMVGETAAAPSPKVAAKASRMFDGIGGAIASPAPRASRGSGLNARRIRVPMAADSVADLAVVES